LRQGFALLAAGTALLLFEDALAAMALELFELDFQLLPGRRDAGVSNSHVS
jgi:hypothetical protein